jgi:hypothetical protein
MTAKTNAERQAMHQRRRERMGLKQVRPLWAHPSDHPAIKAYAAKLRKKRAIDIDKPIAKCNARRSFTPL